MIKIQLVDNGKYKRYYSTSGMMIQKVGTDELYRQAIDIATSTDRYRETDIPIQRGHPTDIFKESVTAILNGDYQLVCLPNAELFNTLKQRVMDAINAETDDKILRTFRWRDIPVWLSMENQNNIKGAYMIARDTPERLPIVMKFGTDDEPVMHTFYSAGDLAELNLAMFDHISACCAEGWQRKYSINWAKIEQALNTE